MVHTLAKPIRSLRLSQARSGMRASCPTMNWSSLSITAKSSRAWSAWRSVSWRSGSSASGPTFMVAVAPALSVRHAPTPMPAAPVISPMAPMPAGTAPLGDQFDRRPCPESGRSHVRWCERLLRRAPTSPSRCPQSGLQRDGNCAHQLANYLAHHPPTSIKQGRITPSHSASAVCQSRSAYLVPIVTTIQPLGLIAQSRHRPEMRPHSASNSS
jgi:hypothetical protein